MIVYLMRLCVFSNMVFYVMLVSTVYLGFVASKPMPLSLPRTITYRSFGLVNQPRLGPRRFGGSWISPSKVSCASRCMEKYDTCWSFLYNSSTGLCTPGSSFDSQQQLPTEAEGNLYNSLTCTPRGFQQYTSNSTTACVGEFQSQTYSGAYYFCLSYGSVLMSVRTNDKMSILMLASGRSDSWVGCDNLNNGVFTWKEDNGALSDEEISVLFLDKPTNQCVSYSYVDRKLTSDNCFFYKSFFCEMPLP